MNINYSFIIPHKNCPDLLQRCVDSIPERDDVQIIVVDDNSDSDKKPALKERKNLQIILLDAAQSKGAGRARNVGLEHAKGKWLVFSDSDDFFVNNLSDFLDAYLNDSHDIIYFNVRECDCYDISKIYAGGNKDRIFKKYKETNNDIYLRVCYTEPWGKFIKRKVVTENNIYFQETMAHNDLLFSVKTGLMAGKVCLVDKPLYWYVTREGSIRHSTESFKKTCDRIRAWNSTQIFLNEQGVNTTFYLPSRPCLRFFKQNLSTYFRLLIFMKRNNMNCLLTFRETLRYWFVKVWKKQAITLEKSLSQISVNTWKQQRKPDSVIND